MKVKTYFLSIVLSAQICIYVMLIQNGMLTHLAYIIILPI